MSSLCFLQCRAGYLMVYRLSTLLLALLWQCTVYKSILVTYTASAATRFQCIVVSDTFLNKHLWWSNSNLDRQERRTIRKQLVACLPLPAACFKDFNYRLPETNVCLIFFSEYWSWSSSGRRSEFSSMSRTAQNLGTKLPRTQNLRRKT